MEQKSGSGGASPSNTSRTPLRAVLLAAALGTAAAGCTMVPTAAGPYEAKFGDTVRRTVASQALNPTPAPAGPLGVMDGGTAVLTIERYRNTFKEPPPTFTVIGIGGGGPAGGR